MHLLRNLTVADLKSPHNDTVVDLRLADGYLVEIGEGLAAKEDETEVDFTGCYVSPGFLDIGPYLGDPGHEDREDLDSLALAAARGGYTAVAPLPNAQPVRHEKSGITYLLESSRGLPVDVLPLGAVSRDTAGADITEMIDMQRSGAVAFTDGLQPIASAGLMSRALHYVKSFGGTIINQPLDRDLSPRGQLHEGLVSTRMGLPGLPPISEQLMLHRDLELLAYADSRLLAHLISCAESLELLAAAKRDGLTVFASVAVANLQFTVDELLSFDPDFKVLPPLREETDRLALIDALDQGTLDCIVSNHIAHEPEQKELEFAYADFGSTALQSCVAQAITVLLPRLSVAKLAALFSHGPRRALALPALHIAEKQPGQLTIFRTDGEQAFQLHPATEKGLNSGVVGRRLKGGPVATYAGGRLRYCRD